MGPGDVGRGDFTIMNIRIEKWEEGGEEVARKDEEEETVVVCGKMNSGRRWGEKKGGRKRGKRG